MGMQYKDIDLDEDPCIFPDCGHFVTRSNMDGIMDMGTHYAISDEGEPVSLATASQPFSIDEVKTCPTCRGSLRNVARYGRIVRRAMLDEVTKKFITWSNTQCLEFLDRLVDAQDRLAKAPRPQPLARNPQPSKLQLAQGHRKEFKKIQDWLGDDNRYKQLEMLWVQIYDFNRQVRVEEQPLQRVADLVKFASASSSASQTQETGASGSNDDLSLEAGARIQTKAQLQVGLLLLKCETSILSDFARLRREVLDRSSRPQIQLSLAESLGKAQILITMAQKSKHIRQEAEGHLFYAQYCGLAMELTGVAKDDSEAIEQLRNIGVEHLDAVRGLMSRNPGSMAGLAEDAELVESMLRDSVFYAPVTSEEKRAVYQAMRAEFSGTGHWYACENGHPFTIGECGMPMEQARCPECQAGIGGQSHRPVQGVRSDDDMEALGRDLAATGLGAQD